MNNLFCAEVYVFRELRARAKIAVHSFVQLAMASPSWRVEDALHQLWGGLVTADGAWG